MRATLLNDVHSQLNPCRVRRLALPESSDEAASLISSWPGRVSVSGQRHSMGGQPYGAETLCLDTAKLGRVLSFDRLAGTITVGCGITWTQLIRFLHTNQEGVAGNWGIRQKQTGADDLTLGGALSANIHGRGLIYAPFVQDIISLRVVQPSGEILLCSRESNQALFRLVIGGYGLFGFITELTLRLRTRCYLRRHCQSVSSADVFSALESLAGQGHQYGDYQFNVDESSPDFLRSGILASYCPTEATSHKSQRNLSDRQWLEFLELAHTDRKTGFEKYRSFYLGTHGQVYDSDLHAFGVYLSDYSRYLASRLRTSLLSTLMITELFVPVTAFPDFMREAAGLLRKPGAPVIYGTVRRIEPDKETFLPWARSRMACIVFNLQMVHKPAKLKSAADRLRSLIDLAVAHGGTYYLTYHRYATGQQLRACYPEFDLWLDQRQQIDPENKFYSDWFASVAGK
jgi:FAD/FMN-containing dehydrogenase